MTNAELIEKLKELIAENTFLREENDRLIHLDLLRPSVPPPSGAWYSDFKENESLRAQLSEAREVIEWYGDGFKIMDHIEGTYTIRKTWYEKARAYLEKYK